VEVVVVVVVRMVILCERLVVVALWWATGLTTWLPPCRSRLARWQHRSAPPRHSRQRSVVRPSQQSRFTPPHANARVRIYTPRFVVPSLNHVSTPSSTPPLPLGTPTAPRGTTMVYPTMTPRSTTSRLDPCVSHAQKTRAFRSPRDRLSQ